MLKNHIAPSKHTLFSYVSSHLSSLHSSLSPETDFSPNAPLYYNYDSVESPIGIIHTIALGVQLRIFCSEFKFSKVFCFPLLLPPRKSLHR